MKHAWHSTQSVSRFLTKHAAFWISLVCAALIGCTIATTGFAQRAPVEEAQPEFVLMDGKKANFGWTEKPGTAQHAVEKPLVGNDALKNKNTDADLSHQILTLQQEVQELRGQLEVQSHALQQLQKKSEAFYRDYDARLAQISKPATDVPHPISSTPTTTMLAKQPEPVIAPKRSDLQAPHKAITTTGKPEEEYTRYMNAYEHIKNRQFDIALHDMEEFITLYPKGAYAANAHYWLGELYLVKKAYPEAITQFEIVSQQYPTSSKIAPGLLKMGYALSAMGKTVEAKKQLTYVTQHYPGTATAQLAQEKLKTL